MLDTGLDMGNPLSGVPIKQDFDARLTKFHVEEDLEVEAFGLRKDRIWPLVRLGRWER